MLGVCTSMPDDFKRMILYLETGYTWVQLILLAIINFAHHPIKVVEDIIDIVNDIKVQKDWRMAGIQLADVVYWLFGPVP